VPRDPKDPRNKKGLAKLLWRMRREWTAYLFLSPGLLLFAVFTALWVLRQGSLWSVIAFHAAWNWVQGNVAGIAVSGNEAPGGALVRLVPDGPAALSGGAFGAEGSLVVTAVLLTATAAAGWSLRRVTVRA